MPSLHTKVRTRTNNTSGPVRLRPSSPQFSDDEPGPGPHQHESHPVSLLHITKLTPPSLRAPGSGLRARPAARVISPTPRTRHGPGTAPLRTVSGGSGPGSGRDHRISAGQMAPLDHRSPSTVTAHGPPPTAHGHRLTVTVHRPRQRPPPTATAHQAAESQRRGSRR